MRVRRYEPRDEVGLTALVQAVADEGGAVGWLRTPAESEIATWRDDMLGTSTLFVVCEAAAILACGAWKRHASEPVHGMAEVMKVMTHPDFRRRGAASRVMNALIGDARAAGIEMLTLELRGNNHGALSLYRRLGFEITGYRPNAVAVGRERWHQILMHMDLRTGDENLVLRGCTREGPGAS